MISFGPRTRDTFSEAGPVAQRLEQGTHNPLVRGSNPCGPTRKRHRTAEDCCGDVTPVGPGSIRRSTPSEVHPQILWWISYPFFSLRHFAQRAFCAARMRAMAAGDILRFRRAEDEAVRAEDKAVRAADDPPFWAFTRAQRARCAAAMRARPAADMPPPVTVVEPVRRKAAIAFWMLCS
jgi:hypothetical protein